MPLNLVKWITITRIATVLGLLILTGCAARPRHEPVAYQLEPWTEGPSGAQKLTTPHYIVYTSVKDPVLVEAFPGLIERAYEYYRALVPSSREPDDRMKVYLFAKRGEWVYFTKRFTGNRANTFLKIRGGGYSERGVSVMQYVAHQVTFPLLAHEGFHQYLHHCVHPAVPAWLNEGLAVVCEGQRWTTSGLEEFDPWYNPARRNLLAESLLKSRLFSLQELLDTHAGRVIHETSARVGTYYAQVWVLILFLREGLDGKYAEGYQQMVNALAAPDLEQRLRAESVWVTGKPLSRGAALFRGFISDDLETCEREYMNFLREKILNAH
ncbi:MAG: hypothetical protein ABIG44_14425 [Planctomycetota bacterium]